MRAEDVPEDYLDALISQLPAKATAGIAEIEFRAALAAVAPLIAKAERERQAVALVDIAKTYREIAACPDWTRKVRDGHKVAAEAFEGRAAAIRALPDE